jgi:uncharacterized protein (TIGR02646 family)
MSNEPNSLKKFRLNAYVKVNIEKNFNGMYEKYYKDSTKEEIEELRNTLKKEQGFICCYCMSSIQNGKTKIEHYKSRDENPKLEVDYKNLYLACDGEKTNCQDNQDSTNIHDLCKCKYKKENSTKRIVKHCDTCKGNRELEYVKFSSIEDYIKYKSDCTIYSDVEHIDKELNYVLNLNVDILRKNRLTAKDDLWNQLPKNRTWTNEKINKLIEKYKNQSTKAPYLGVILYFLNKKLIS